MDIIGSAPTPSLALRRAYRKAGPQTWALIRELYLAGVPAAELSAQFDVSVHTIRKRATREGWSRKAQAAAIPDLRLPPGAHFASIPAASGAEGPAGEGGAAAEVEADPLEAARLVLRRAAGAATAGRLAQAAEAVRLAEGLARAAAALGFGGGARRAALGVEAPAAAADDDDEEAMSPEAHAALRADFLERAKRRGLPRWDSPLRVSPDRLPYLVDLRACAEFRPLAEAMGLATEETGELECPDFDAALAKARREGRGPAIDYALGAPLCEQVAGWPAGLWTYGVGRTEEGVSAEEAARLFAEGQARRRARFG